MKSICLFITFTLTTLSCATGGMVSGNDGGSAPINEQETVQYQKAINRCYKTGGTRVVKIEGKLRCF